jgi:hypothetical protein
MSKFNTGKTKTKKTNARTFTASANKTTIDNTEHYKSICVSFTKSEYEMLNKIANTEHRSKLKSIKHAVLAYASAL